MFNHLTYFMVSHNIGIVGTGLLMTEEDLNRYEPQVEAERRYRGKRCRVQITFNLESDEELLSWLRSRAVEGGNSLSTTCKDLIIAAYEQSKK